MKTQLLPLALIICLPLSAIAQWNTNSGGLTYYTSTSNGYKVGIGVNPATEKLHVAGNILSSGTVSGTTFISNGAFQAGSTSNLVLRTDNVSRLTILNSNGFIGINTSAPTLIFDRLHVSDNDGTGRLNIRVGFTATLGLTGGAYQSTILGNQARASVTADNRMDYISSSSTGARVIKMKPDEGISFHTFYGPTVQGNEFTGFERMRIKNTGEVGIGTILTSNPNNYKLAVNGKIGAKEVQVETSSSTWPDFVFAKDYALSNINEVEQFIAENGHLPGVPSATEIEKNGHRLGEMDAVLLKKIEELTLYLIELKKEIETLKQNTAANK